MWFGGSIPCLRTSKVLPIFGASQSFKSRKSFFLLSYWVFCLIYLFLVRFPLIYFYHFRKCGERAEEWKTNLKIFIQLNWISCFNDIWLVYKWSFTSTVLVLFQLILPLNWPIKFAFHYDPLPVLGRRGDYPAIDIEIIITIYFGSWFNLSPCSLWPCLLYTSPSPRD